MLSQEVFPLFRQGVIPTFKEKIMVASNFYAFAFLK